MPSNDRRLHGAVGEEDLWLSRTVVVVLRDVTGYVGPSKLVNSILVRHPEYGGSLGGSTDLAPEPSEIHLPAFEWLAQVRALFDPGRAPELHGRLVVIGLSLLDTGVGSRLSDAGILQAVINELSEPLDTLLTPRGHALRRRLGGQGVSPEQRFSRLSPSSRSALSYADGLSKALGKVRVHMEHLLIGLNQEASGPLRRLLAQAGIVGQEDFVAALMMDAALPDTVVARELTSLPALSRHAAQAVDHAFRLADAVGSPLVRSRYLLRGALSVSVCGSVEALARRGVRAADIEGLNAAEPAPERYAAKPTLEPAADEPASGPGSVFPKSPPSADTRTAYARLDTLDRVVPHEVFELRVGLAPSPTRGVSGPAMQVPKAAFTLTVQLIADGFRVLGGASLTRELAVSPEDPHPYDVLRLQPDDDPTLAPVRTILGIFSVDGHTVGVASRGVLVTSPETAPAERPAVAPGVDWVLPTDPDTPRPDLEIVVAPGNDATGAELAWFYRSRHEAVGSALVPERTRLPGNTAEWARAMVRGIEDHRDAPDLAEHLLGRAHEVRAAIPGEIWTALGAAARVSSPPTVLLATWEPFLPWELARVPEPWDAVSPPFLGAQAVIGRWTYSEQVRSPAPPTQIEARTMAVVWGEYSTSPLPEAEEEGSDLQRRYEAVRVEALTKRVLDCLKGKPAVDLLHFAVHGKLDYTGTQDGIQMVDRTYLGPPSVRGVEHTGTHMVFLNACQVAGGQRALGEYVGMAAALIGIEVGAVVAPLWKVDDTVAREVAEECYRAVLGSDPVSPAEFLRRERRSTKGREGSPAGTRLAYLFFGHPLLRVDWNGPRNQLGGDDA